MQFISFSTTHWYSSCPGWSCLTSDSSDHLGGGDKVLLCTHETPSYSVLFFL